MIKKLLNIYDEDLYLSIQIHAKMHKSDANAFINKAMEEKAMRDGVKMVEKTIEEKSPADVSFEEPEIADVDFEEVPPSAIEDGLTF